MLQAVIFDHDGTLAPTNERQQKWFTYWWSHRENEASVQGKKFLFTDLEEFMEMYNREINHPLGVQNVYDFLGLSCDMNDRNHPVWTAYEAFNQENPVLLYDGVPEMLQSIWEMGHLSRDSKMNRRLRLGINTSNSWRNVYSDLSHNNVLPYFDCFVTKDVLMDYHGAGGGSSLEKPSKISLDRALGLLDCEGEYTIHVGDTLNDLAASQKVSRLHRARPETLLTIGVTWGYEAAGKGKEKARRVLEQGVEVTGEGRAYFNHIVDEPSEITSIVKKYLHH